MPSSKASKRKEMAMCKYCENGYNLDRFYDEDTDTDYFVSIEPDGSVYYSNDDTCVQHRGYEKMSYCPMCGRNLKQGGKRFWLVTAPNKEQLFVDSTNDKTALMQLIDDDEDSCYEVSMRAYANVEDIPTRIFGNIPDSSSKEIYEVEIVDIKTASVKIEYV